MAMLRHPLSGTEYYSTDDDNKVRVVSKKSGTEGEFRRDGTWISGERRTDADPALAQWLADASLITRGRVWQFRDQQQDSDTAESGPELEKQAEL